MARTRPCAGCGRAVVPEHSPTEWGGQWYSEENGLACRVVVDPAQRGFWDAGVTEVDYHYVEGETQRRYRRAS